MFAHKSLSSTLMRAVLLTAFAVVGGCIPASNVCDPDAPSEDRARSSIAGFVRDQDGLAVSGVSVFATGGGSAVSDVDGKFLIDGLLPNVDGEGYELLALPAAPLVGGRTEAPPLGCREDITEVVVPVVVPPPSPEVEIAEATAPDRLFVAFSATGSGLDATFDATTAHHALANCGKASTGIRYRVEVRAPFGTWQEAVMANAPVTTAVNGTGLDSSSVIDDIDDACARANCGYFTWAHESIERAENARCAEVVGIRDENGSLAPLTCYERYEVRVRADTMVDDDQQKDHAFPSRVPSLASATPLELSLTPTAVLPVAMNEDASVNASLHADLDIQAVVPVGVGRFAIIDGHGVKVIGGGELDEEDRTTALGMAPSTDDGMVMDADSSSDAQSEVAAQSATAVAILPAGKWVRVWKRIGPASMIDKVCVGRFAGDECNAEGQQPIFDVDMDNATQTEEFRGFRWLTAPTGDPTNGPYNPPDAYLLLFSSGIVMFEQSPVGETTMGDMATSSDFFPDSGVGLCNAINGLGSVTIGGSTKSGACWDLKSSRPNVDVSDLQILRSTSDAEPDPASTFHVLANQNSDHVIAIRSDHLIGTGLPPGVGSVDELAVNVKVGLEPVALSTSRTIDCSTGETHPVMLVANRGSQDLSILETVVEASGLRVRERAVIPLPSVPVRFFPDIIGPTCDDPYAWVVADDGRTFPVDMRVDRLNVPTCGDGACGVDTRSRARAGAVGRNNEGRGRVLLGGEGVMAEVGFLRPSKQRCFEDCRR